MRSTIIVLVILLSFSIIATAQFKSQMEQQSVSQSLVRPMTSMNSFLGLLNPDNFMMRHNLAFSYLSSDGTGLSIASYTNSMFYKISDPLNVRFDLTLQGSPFGQSAYQNSLSGLFLSRAELNYRPWENFFIKLQYNHLPANYFGMYDGWYNPYSSSFFRGDE